MIIPAFRITNDFLCCILYIFTILSCLTFRDKKILFYEVESLLMTTRETLAVSAAKPFPFRRHISQCDMCGQSFACLLFVWQRPCLLPSLLNPYHLTETVVPGKHFLSKCLLNCSYDGRKHQLSYKGHNDSPPRTLPLLQWPEKIHDDYLPIY